MCVSNIYYKQQDRLEEKKNALQGCNFVEMFWRDYKPQKRNLSCLCCYRGAEIARMALL